MGIEDFEYWVRKIYHSRTPSDSLLHDSICVIGAGGAGTWFTVIYSMHLLPSSRILIVDNDVIEPHNLNRLPFPVVIGVKREKKGKVLAEFIKMLRPWVDVIFVNKRIETETDLEELYTIYYPQTIVDASDNVVTINLIKKFAKNKEIDYLGLHYDGYDITIEYIRDWWQYKEDWIVDSNASGYQVFPSSPIPASILGALGARILLLRPPSNILIKTSIDDILSRVNVFIRKCDGE